ncbi:MAG TPA: DUF6632 domain-containing protein [Terriglobales bacterium]
MVRERILKVVLVLVGLLFCALIYPGLMFFSRDPAVAMMMSLYVTLGVFLLIAARDPVTHRSLILYAGWANLAHASVMAVQSYRHVIEHQELFGVFLFGVIGIVLITLTPSKETSKQGSVANPT